jgi:hypothetical protein
MGLLTSLLPREAFSNSGLTVWDLDGESGIGTSFFPSCSVVPCQLLHIHISFVYSRRFNDSVVIYPATQ